METKIKQEKGLQFESYIMDYFAKHKNISLSHYTTYQEQIDLGENRQGIEIKNDQRFQDTKNLFIIDSSIFPSSSGVNIASTVQAVSLMISDHIKKNLIKFINK